jgi:hypothetical protein
LEKHLSAGIATRFVELPNNKMRRARWTVADYWPNLQGKFGSWPPDTLLGEQTVARRQPHHRAFKVGINNRCVSIVRRLPTLRFCHNFAA